MNYGASESNGMPPLRCPVVPPNIDSLPGLPYVPAINQGKSEMKKLYERPVLAKRGNLKSITASINGPIVISGPIK
jgi:hypothetical protein